MKTIEKKYYVCEICGKSSSDERKVCACQNKHAVFDEETNIEPFYSKGIPFPGILRIKFSNGLEIQYKWTNIISEGGKENG